MRNYTDFKYSELNNNKNISSILMKTFIIPLLKTINCTKNVNNNDYNCEITEYSLRVCVKNILKLNFLFKKPKK